jgi:2-methylcitrate dehydratase
MVATMLVFDRLEASDYVDGSDAATSPLVESLRQRIYCIEDPLFTSAYHDPATRFIPNAVTVILDDDTQLREIIVKAPLGHRSRREEAKPEIMRKYRRHLRPHFPDERVEALVRLGEDEERLEEMDVDRYVDLYVKDNMKWREIDN